MRKRKPTNGRVTGVKFPLQEKEKSDLKKIKVQILKELEEGELSKQQWYDQEMDKNLKKL